jgi:hypothetical protein
MVDGSDWGDETPTMLEVTGLLAGSEPSVGVLAGGGEIAAEEVHGHLLARRPVIVLAGSGRLADRVVEALGRGTPVPFGTDEEEHRELLEVVELDGPLTTLAASLRDRLRRKRS